MARNEATRNQDESGHPQTKTNVVPILASAVARPSKVHMVRHTSWPFVDDACEVGPRETGYASAIRDPPKICKWRGTVKLLLADPPYILILTIFNTKV